MNTCEIVSALKQLDTQIKEIRATRDELHFEFMQWGDVVESWKGDLSKKSQEKAEKIVRGCYRFLARHYPQMVVWER